MSERPGNFVNLPIKEINMGQSRARYDELATEEPMEIRVMVYENGMWSKHPIAVTMRTPGNDFELSAGFLFSEGVVKTKYEIRKISYCTDPEEQQDFNIVNVYLAEDVKLDYEKLSRHVYTSSSCGICGKASLDQVRLACDQMPVGNFELTNNAISTMPSILRRSQSIFSRTGGLHASALFDNNGNLLSVREDVGRHNALDKLVGALLLSEQVPASNTVLIVSGRASFELVQKAVIAGIPFLAAIGAPSSLAVQLSREYGMTLVGFLRDGHFNVYSGTERITLPK